MKVGSPLKSRVTPKAVRRLAALSLIAGAVTSLAQVDIPDGEALPALSVIPVQGNVYMIPGAGGNIAVQIGDMEKSDFSRQKSLHSFLVGRVECGWKGPSTPACFIAQIQTGKIRSVRSGKTQLAHLLEVEVIERHLLPLWVG